MIKRILTIASITGAGQLFIIFSLKYISQHSSPEQVKAIGQIDSLVLFMINVIALGLQPAAMRNIAQTENWQKEFYSTQSARFTLSVCLASLSLLAVMDQSYLGLLLAPLLALSGEYALYGRGFPVTGSLVAFTRSVIPFLALIIFIEIDKPGWLSLIYLASLAIIYTLTNIFISSFFKISFYPAIKFNNLKLYLNTLSLGVVSLGLYFIGMGIILVAQYFYTDLAIATAFIGLKFFTIFKGLLRIIQQAFLKEMTRDDVCLKVDQLSSLLGLGFLTFIICFPNSFINFFFASRYVQDKNYFIALGIAACIYSLFSSFTTRALLAKKDRTYALITSFAAFFTIIINVLLSFVWQNPLTIGISIVSGELVFAVGMLWLMKRKKFLKQRFLFLLENIPFLIIPITVLLLAGDTQPFFFISIFVFALAMFLQHKKRFRITEVS